MVLKNKYFKKSLGSGSKSHILKPISCKFNGLWQFLMDNDEWNVGIAITEFLKFQ